MDGDGLLDYFELVYGTNATSGDTDDDGLGDYLEISGWVIAFKYFGNDFTTRVCSDPSVPDSDGVGLDDYIEYLNDLNPRSRDTDGDGVNDEEKPPFEISIELDEDYNVTVLQECEDMAVDKNGYVYFL